MQTNVICKKTKSRVNNKYIKNVIHINLLNVKKITRNFLNMIPIEMSICRVSMKVPGPHSGGASRGTALVIEKNSAQSIS